MSRRIRTVVAAFIALSVPSAALAQSGPGCLLPPAKVSDESIAAFKTEPAALMKKHPAGGFGMSSDVRGLAASDMSTVDLIIEAAKTGNTSQQASIGAGLSQASTLCVRVRQDLAQQIQQKVAAAGLPDLVTAFLSTTQQLDVAAAPAAGVGAIAGGAGGGASPIGGAGAGAGGGAGGTGATNRSGSASVTSVGAPSNLSSSGGGLFSSSRSRQASSN